MKNTLAQVLYIFFRLPKGWSSILKRHFHQTLGKMVFIFFNKAVYWEGPVDHLRCTFMSCDYSKKSGKIKTAYKREYVNAGLDVDLDFAGPTIHGAAVAGYEGWLAGYQMTIDSAKSKMTHSNFAIGYKTGDFQLHTNVYVLLHRHARVIVKELSVMSRTPFRQKQRVRVQRLHLPEGQWQTGDCCESGLDSRQQWHPLWNCC